MSSGVAFLDVWQVDALIVGTTASSAELVAILMQFKTSWRARRSDQLPPVIFVVCRSRCGSSQAPVVSRLAHSAGFLDVSVFDCPADPNGPSIGPESVCFPVEYTAKFVDEPVTDDPSHLHVAVERLVSRAESPSRIALVSWISLFPFWQLAGPLSGIRAFISRKAGTDELIQQHRLDPSVVVTFLNETFCSVYWYDPCDLRDVQVRWLDTACPWFWRIQQDTWIGLYCQIWAAATMHTYLGRLYKLLRSCSTYVCNRNFDFRTAVAKEKHYALVRESVFSTGPFKDQIDRWILAQEDARKTHCIGNIIQHFSNAICTIVDCLTSDVNSTLLPSYGMMKDMQESAGRFYEQLPYWKYDLEQNGIFRSCPERATHLAKILNGMRDTGLAISAAIYNAKFDIINSSPVFFMTTLLRGSSSPCSIIHGVAKATAGSDSPCIQFTKSPDELTHYIWLAASSTPEAQQDRLDELVLHAMDP